MTLERLQAVVLMGGLGTRLGRASAGLPKSMVQVAGEPFFAHQLRLMRAQGVRRFLFCVGHRSEAVRRHFGSGRRYGVRIEYSYDGPAPLGTGGALRRALPRLDPEFLVMYGDTYLDADLGELACRWTEARLADRRLLGLMAVYRNVGRSGRSNVLFRAGRLVRYAKRRPMPGMRHIDYGLSFLRRQAVRLLPAARPSDLADLLERLSARGALAGREVPRPYHEIGTPRALRAFASWLAERRSKPAVFVDRDGTINELVWNEDAEQLDSPLRPDQLRLVPGAVRGLRRLRRLGYRLIVVTNQPAAAKGKARLGALYDVNAALAGRLARAGAGVDDVVMCAHHPAGNGRAAPPDLVRACDCRKPKPGLILRAAEKHGIDLRRSFMAGDSHIDVLAARAAGVRPAFVGRFKCESCQRLQGRHPAAVFEDLDAFSRRVPKTRRGR